MRRILSASRLLFAIGSFVAVGQAANLSNCTISNLPASFSLRVGGGSNGTGEIAVAVWENFSNISSGVGNKCYDDNGGSEAVLGPAAIQLVNGNLSMVIRSSDSMYRAVLDQLRFAKANLLQSDVNIRLTWDAKLGWLMNSVATK